MEELLSCAANDDSVAFGTAMKKVDYESVLSMVRMYLLHKLIRQNSFKCCILLLEFLKSEMAPEEQHRIANAVRVRSTGFGAAELLLEKMKEKSAPVDLILKVLDLVLFDFRCVCDLSLTNLLCIIQMKNSRWNSAIVDIGRSYCLVSQFDQLDETGLKLLLDVGLIYSYETTASSMLQYFVKNSKKDFINLLLEDCCIKTNVISMQQLYITIATHNGSKDHITYVLKHHFKNNKDLFRTDIQVLIQEAINECYSPKQISTRRWNDRRPHDKDTTEKNREKKSLSYQLLKEWLQHDDLNFSLEFLVNTLQGNVGSGHLADVLCKKYFQVMDSLSHTRQTTCNLPEELIGTIAHFLQPEDALTLSQTCSSFRKLICGETFQSYWSRWLERLWPGATIPKHRPWRLVFVQLRSKAEAPGRLFTNENSEDWTLANTEEKMEWKCKQEREGESAYSKSTTLTFNIKEKTFHLYFHTTDLKDWRHWQRSKTFEGHFTHGVGHQSNCIVLISTTVDQYTDQAKDPKHYLYRSNDVFRAWVVQNKATNEYEMMLFGHHCFENPTVLSWRDDKPEQPQPAPAQSTTTAASNSVATTPPASTTHAKNSKCIIS